MFFQFAAIALACPYNDRTLFSQVWVKRSLWVSKDYYRSGWTGINFASLTPREITNLYFRLEFYDSSKPSKPKTLNGD